MACAAIATFMAEAGAGEVIGSEVIAGLSATEALGTGLTAGGLAEAGAVGAQLAPEFAAGFGAELAAGGAAAGGAAYLGGDAMAASGIGAGGVTGAELAAGSLVPLGYEALGLGAGVPAAVATNPLTGAALSFPTLSQLGSGMNIATGIYGMSQAEQMKRLAMAQANKASPWQSGGGGDLATQQLMALISGKTDVSAMPGYKAGEQAVQRSMAAQGYQGSGNMMAALNQFGGKFYNDAVTQLSGLAGVGFNPVSSGQLAVTGGQNAATQNLAAMSLINKTLETAGRR